MLLNKIVTPEDQEKVVERAIEQLVSSSKETSPLLNALKGKTFRSKSLEHLAIQKAFMEGVKSGIVNRLPEDICEHAAITPELYADALTVAAGWVGISSTRKFLLKQADRYDLQVVKEKLGYTDIKPEFRNAIEKAWGQPSLKELDGLRIFCSKHFRFPRKRLIEITGKEFSGITDITGSFLTGQPTTEREPKLSGKLSERS